MVQRVADFGLEVDGLIAVRGRRLEAFNPAYRRSLDELAGRGRAVADLADTFPALLFALATGHGTREQREAALALVECGKPLRSAAQALGLPLWLRRLPPEALTGPLNGLPDGPDMAQRISAYIPSNAEVARGWLSAVRLAALACHDGFALWTASWAAKHHRALTTDSGLETLIWLAAWAWHSGRPDLQGYRLLRRAWTPSMGYRRALEEVVVWRQRIGLALVLDGHITPERLPQPGDGHAHGYDFVALRTAEEFIGEADVMANCLDQFANRLAERYSRVYSIRRNGRTVADLEIGLHELEQTMPVIRQLRGVRNRRAAAEVWQAAYAWLGSQSLRPVQVKEPPAKISRLRVASRNLWQPYLSAVGDGPAADHFTAAVHAFDKALASGAGCGRVRVVRQADAPIW